MPPFQQVQDPPSFAYSVVRQAVLAQLVRDGLPPTKLIAVTAPTGYGKTTLLAQLFEDYRQGGADCRWVALDDRDTMVEHLLRRLEVALAPRRDERDPGEVLHVGDEAVEDRIAALLAAAGALAAPAVLFIDNLNACTDESAAGLLDALVFESPSWFHVVLASTASLPFSRGRARLAGLLTPVDYEALSLNRDEIATVFGPDLVARLAPSALDTVRERTEGWPAGVRLMQIVLAASDDPDRALASFSGEDEDLAALLNRQVLHAFAPELRRFVLEIAPLRTFSVDLCRAATGDEQAEAHVETLLKRNLLVIPLDRNRTWYRLHGLLRAFFVGEAARIVKPARSREVLARAAEWCERAGRWHEAVEYALASESPPLAAAILDRIAAVFVRDQGDLRLYIEWIERLRAAGSDCGLEADFWYVWALIFHRRYDYARRQRERLVARLASDDATLGDEAAREAFRRRIEVLGIAIAIYTDRLAEGHHSAMRWLEQARDDDPFDIATVATAASIHLVGTQQLVEARRVMRLAQSSINQSASEYGFGWVVAVSAMIALQEGDFVLAGRDLAAGYQRARRVLGENAGMTAMLALLAAKAAVERGEDEEARAQLKIGLRKVQTHGILDTAAIGLDAAVKLWTGSDDDEALGPAQLREIAGAYPPRLSTMLSCFLIRRLLRLGRVEEAQAEAAQSGIVIKGDVPEALIPGLAETPASRDLRMAAEIELMLAAGRLRQAESLVQAQTKLARDQGRGARLVELALDEATICACSHNPQHAARHLVRAISLAARRQYLRPFRDRAEMIAGLVNETKAKDWGFAVDEERRFFATVCRGLPAGKTALLDHLEEMNVTPSLTETPTARELELLSLVEAGLSNQQLADRLSVSVATVKWHLYNLYAKLGVSSRAAALARARALNLLVR